MTEHDEGLVGQARAGAELRYGGSPPTGETAERMLEVPTALLLDARQRNPALAALDLPGALERLEHAWIECDGAQIHAEVHAVAPDVASVVIVHGLGDHARRLTPLAVALGEAGFNAISLDRRGHGLSEGRRGDATLEDDFAVLRLGITEARRRFAGPVVLLGDSLGGIMIWYWLTQDPDVAAAVCHDISHPDVSLDRSMRFKAPLMRALGTVAPRLTIPIRRIANYDHVALDPVTKVYFDDELDRLFNFGVSARSAASYLGFRPQVPWERVAIPVLVIAGAEDRMVSPRFIEASLARAQPPATTYVKVPGAGHQLFLDDLDASLAPLLEWLREAVGAEPARAGATR
ncbi:MAG TPA: alpha/beta fold hydrolase [Solirubrobacterales bacterium]|nr:alpha/beta fold hydrolase [Solirubrobacterales bacterium]